MKKGLHPMADPKGVVWGNCHPQTAVTPLSGPPFIGMCPFLVTVEVETEVKIL